MLGPPNPELIERIAPVIVDMLRRIVTGKIIRVEPLLCKELRLHEEEFDCEQVIESNDEHEPCIHEAYPAHKLIDDLILDLNLETQLKVREPADDHPPCSPLDQLLKLIVSTKMHPDCYDRAIKHALAVLKLKGIEIPHCKKHSKLLKYI